MISGENGATGAEGQDYSSKKKNLSHLDRFYEEVKQYLLGRSALISAENEILSEETTKHFSDPTKQYEITQRQLEIAGRMSELKAVTNFIHTLYIDEHNS